MVFCYCNTLCQNPQEKDAIYRRLPKYESPAAAPHSGSSITMVSRYCPSSACTPGRACPPGCLRKEYAWIRLLTCKAQAPKKHRQPLAAAAGKPVHSSAGSIAFHPPAVHSCTISSPLPKPYNIILPKIITGPRADSPNTRNRLTTRPSVRYSMPKSCTAPCILPGANSLCHASR